MTKSNTLPKRVLLVLAAFLCVAALKYGMDHWGITMRAEQSVSGGLQHLMSGVH